MKIAIITIIWLAVTVLLALPGIREYQALANVEDSSRKRKREMRKILIILALWFIACAAVYLNILTDELQSYE